MHFVNKVNPFSIIGLDLFLFMCALFTKRFGYKKILLVYYFPFSVGMIWGYQYLRDFASSFWRGMNPLFINPIPIPSELVVILVITWVYLWHGILLYLYRKGFEKIGIYNRFNF